MSVALVVLLASTAPAVLRQLDGSAEVSEHDTSVAALCGAPVRGGGLLAVRQKPWLAQTGPSSVRVVAVGLDADALFLTDEDDTVLAFSSSLNATSAGNATAELELGDHRPMALRAHAHYPECVTMSARAPSWDAQLADFNYEAAGGVMNTSGLRDADLLASEPRVDLAADGREARLTMLQQPRLFVPLVYVKCDSDRIVALHTFHRAEWPADGATVRWGEALTLPPGCLSVRACATIPTAASAGCGGHPERCTELDLLPRITAAIERASPPQRLAAPADASIAARGAALIEVRPAALECARLPTTYVKDEEGRVAAYGHGALHVQLVAVGARALLAVYSYCEPRSRLVVQNLNVSTLLVAAAATAHQPPEALLALAASGSGASAIERPPGGTGGAEGAGSQRGAVGVRPPIVATALAAPSVAGGAGAPPAPPGWCADPTRGVAVRSGSFATWSGAHCSCVAGRLVCGPSALARTRSFLLRPSPISYVLLAASACAVTLLLIVAALRFRCVRSRLSLAKDEMEPLKLHDSMREPTPPPTPPHEEPADIR